MFARAVSEGLPCCNGRMDRHVLIQGLLEQVSARMGDPAPAVYARLFEASPHLLPLFVADTRGLVRGEMFMRALDTLVDLASGRPYAPGMIESERVTHGHLDIDAATFESFFHHIGAVFRDALGADWSPDLDRVWRDLMGQVAAAIKGSSAQPLP